MIFTAALFGLTFPLMKLALEDIPVFTLNTLRFYLAGIPLLVFCWLRKIPVSSKVWKSGTLCGVILFSGYALQTSGVKISSAALASFLSGLFVIITPFFALIFLKISISQRALWGVLFSLSGLIVLSNARATEFGWGEWLVLLGAIGFAAHIVAITGCKGLPVIPLTAVQLTIVGILSHAFSLFGPNSSSLIEVCLQASNLSLICIALMAIFSTVLAFALQISFQQLSDPTAVAIAFSFEPVWGAVLSAIILGDYLGPVVYLGGLLILLGTLIVEIPSRFFLRPMRRR